MGCEIVAFLHAKEIMSLILMGSRFWWLGQALAFPLIWRQKAIKFLDMTLLLHLFIRYHNVLLKGKQYESSPRPSPLGS